MAIAASIVATQDTTLISGGHLIRTLHVKLVFSDKAILAVA